MGHFNVDQAILYLTSMGLGHFNIKIINIIKNCFIEVQNLIFIMNEFNFFSFNSKEMAIFNKIKNNPNIDTHSNSQVIVESLVCENKYIVKQSKKNIM